MTFLKKSLAVLLAVAMMIGSMSVAASAWNPATDDGKTVTIVHEFYRYNEKTGEWDIKTDRAKPGEIVKMRAKVTTDYYTNSSNSALFYDNRFFTILDSSGQKPADGVNFITNMNASYLGLGAKDNNSMWYSKNTSNFNFKQTVQASGKVKNYLNGKIDENNPEVTLAEFIENYNAVKSTIYFSSTPYNTKLDGTEYLYEYQFEVNNNPTVKTPGNKGTVCLPPQVAANADYAMLFNFPKGPSDERADKTLYFGLGWTPEIVTDQELATISVFSDVILDANDGSFTIDGKSAETRTVSGVIGEAVKDISSVLPEKEGYVFAGWSLTEDGAILSNEEIAALTHDYEDMTLYAIYSKSDSYYTVELFEMLTDGTYSDTPSAQQKVPEVAGKTVNYPAVPQTGFHLDESKENITSITVADDNSSVIRVYYARNTYQAIYHYEDAAGEKTDKVSVLYGASIPDSAAVPGGPSKAGFEFKGWSTDKDKLVDIPTTMPSEDVEFYPIFEPIVYIYTFNADGGKLINKDNEEVEIITVYYYYGDVPSFPADPVKPGFTFAEWDNNLPATVTENMDFEAVYNQDVYTVKFTDNGVVKYQTTAYYGDKISADVIPEGYKENAWTVNDTATVAVFPYEITKHTEFKATQDALVYDAVFNAGEGEFEGGLKTQTVPTLFDEEVTAPEKNPTLYGHDFIMWDPMVEGTIMQEGGLIFNAIYEPADFTVKLYDDDGETVLKEVTKTFGDSLEDLQNYKPEKPGYDFVKWSEEIPDTMGGEEFEATAIWKAKTNKLEFYDADGKLVDIITAETGSPITAPDYPEVDGYVYSGWVDENGEGVPATMPANGGKFTAVREPAEVTITLDANGGTLTSDATIVAKFGDAINKPSDPTLEGNEFLGWSTSKNGLVVAFPETMPAKDTTYYAVWKTNEHLATFNANGSTFKVNGEAVYSQLVKYGDTIKFPELNDREGYLFTGWSPSTETMPNENVIFTAQWEYIPTGKAGYTIYIYTVNPASGEYIETIKTGTTESGNKIEIVPDGVTSDAAIVIDYEGLNHTESNVPDTDNAKNILSITADELKENKLVAYFKLATFTATFNANGGTIVSGDSEVTGTWGTALKAPEVSYDGYVFAGWEPSVPSTLTESKEYVAQWTEILPDKFVVTINPNGGTFPDGSTDTWTSEQLEEGEALSNLPGNPTKDGFEFKGWLESTTGNVLDNIPATVPGANTVYTAQWEEIITKEYKINYYLVKGGELYDFDNYKEGDEISYIIPAEKDIEGFDFEKWVDENGNDLPKTMGTDDINAYAKLTPKKFTVTYMNEGKVFFEAKDVAYGSEVPKTTDVPVSSNPNKEFSGWTDSTGKTPTDYATMPAKDLVFEANYKDKAGIGEYEVTFISDGVVISSANVKVGEKIVTPEDPKKFGYKFVGWAPEVPETMPAYDCEFVAQFEVDKTFVTVIIGGSVIGGGTIGALAGIGATLMTGAAIIGGVLVIVGASQLAKHTFTVTYLVDGEVYRTYKVVEGTKIPVPADPAKDGAEFAGWNPEVPSKMPGKDMTFEATWESEIVDIPNTGSFAGIAAFATVSAAAAAAYVMTAKKKKED